MAIKDIEIKQGKTFEFLFLAEDVNGAPLDMTGYTGGTAGTRGMIRKKYLDTLPIATFTFSVLNNTVVLAAIAAGTCHLTTEQIAALLPDTSGKCYVVTRLSATVTKAIPKGSYVYDIETEDTTGFVDENFRGAVTVLSEATWSAP